MPVCRICRNDAGNVTYTALEMMLGLREPFDYFECKACGCLQIAGFPDNMARYYPEGYYSYKSIPRLSDNFLIRWIKHHRIRHQSGDRNLFGRFLSLTTKTPVFYEYFKNAGVTPRSRILDVGCGFGKLLLWMKREGFNNILGIDPFIGETINYPNGLTILKKELKELNEVFDFIMLHHAFEHMPDPWGTLQQLCRITRPGGTILLRIPLVSSYAWQTFGINWIALDAPRHFYLHTPKSMTYLAEKSGFEIRKIVYDSFEIQFWGSIQYQKNISLTDPESYLNNKKNPLFSKRELHEFKRRSIQLNRDKTGDAAGFYLVKT